MCCRSGFDNVRHNVDITVRGFRVRALHVRAINQLLGGLSIYTGQTHIQTSLNVVVSVSCTKVHFNVNADIRR